MKRRILLVCTGNVCRSPMAAALLAHRAARAGAGEEYAITSAGTWGLDGEPASANAQVAMQRRGLDLSAHRARTITREMLEEADLVLVMAQGHIDSLSAEFPSARPKLRLLTELSGKPHDVGDPYGRSIEEYEVCAQELERLIDAGYPRLEQWLAADRVAETG